jgi:hypothetical protein
MRVCPKVSYLCDDLIAQFRADAIGALARDAPDAGKLREQHS